MKKSTMFFQFLLFCCLINLISGCETTTMTLSRDATNVTSININSDVGLTVTVVEAESFAATLSFYGRDNANTLFSDAFNEASLTWSLTIGSSASTDPPSSANSQVFFSDATRDALFGVPPAFLASTMAFAQCTETAHLEMALPAGWEVTSEAAKAVSLGYSGPHSYGYEMVVSFPSETVSTWTSADEEAFLQDLIAFYNDDHLTFFITSCVDISGQLTITVEVVGFPTSSSAWESYTGVSTNGLALSSSAFSDITTTASAPALGCSAGFSLTADVCENTDGCVENTCGHGVCVDMAPPANGYTCECEVGYYDDDGTCADVDGCASNTCGSHGSCVDTAAPGTGYTCSCADGYEDVSNMCQGCGVPSQTGYTIASGGVTYDSVRTVTCASGYIGTASSITCQSSGSWTTSTGCNVNCSVSPTQTGYTISAGASTHSSTRTVTCATGYAGTASVITCNAGTWSVFV
jgi:hypothetical protein